MTAATTSDARAGTISNSIASRRPLISAALRRVTDRATRVTALIAVAAALGLTDLGVTLHYMTTTGMCEANQIARIAALGGPWGLIGLKLSSISVFASLLYGCRRRPSAEIGAWAAVAVMTGVMAMWVDYALVVNDAALIEGACPNAWVRL